MNTLPSNFKKTNISAEWCKKELFTYYLGLLREDIYLHVLKNELNSNFYDLNGFLRRYEIHNDIETYYEIISKELINRGFFVKRIFGDTGIIIGVSEDDLEKNSWNNSFDNEII